MTDDTGQPSLAQLVRDARAARKMSVREVADASGGAVGFGSVSAIELGKRDRVEPRTLEALSKTLGIPIAKLRAANGDPTRVPREPFVLPDDLNALTARDRRLVVDVARGLLAARRGE